MSPRRVHSEPKTTKSLLTLLLNLLWDVSPPDRTQPVVILERSGR